MIGQECPSCNRYFKVKPGTGPNTDECVCPYCEHTGATEEFWTGDQVKYAHSFALKEFDQRYMKPMIQKLDRSLRRSSRNSLIELSLRYTPSHTPIHRYSEQDLETDVTCANCGLEYAVFTVFATCPDCADPNMLDVFHTSIAIATKRLLLADGTDDAALGNDLIADALGSGIAAFDTLGKRLRERYPTAIPARPRNPFQNLTVVADALSWDIDSGPFGDLDHDQRTHLSLMFQVRHLFEHNGGVVDEDFCRKVPGMEHLLSRRYPLTRSDAEALLSLLPQLGERAVERTKAIENRA